MSYCKQGEKATVVYSFNNGNENRFVTENTPIDVATYQKRINTTSNYNEEGYTLNFYSPNNRITQDYTIRDHIIFQVIDTTGKLLTAISWINCDAFDFHRRADGELSGPDIDTSTLIYKPEIKCPKPLTNKCSIEVKHKGIIIFQDQGDCPVGFSVICGDCPEGTFKCNATGYPGYCCLPCEPIASSIKTIKNTVQALNKGGVSRG